MPTKRTGPLSTKYLNLMKRSDLRTIPNVGWVLSGRIIELLPFRDYSEAFELLREAGARDTAIIELFKYQLQAPLGSEVVFVRTAVSLEDFKSAYDALVDKGVF